MHDAEGLRRWTWPHALEIVRSRDALLAAVSYILIAAMCLHWMHPGTVIETGDNYWQYRPFHALLRSFAGWNHFVNVAGARSVGPYALPWLLLAALLSAAENPSHKLRCSHCSAYLRGPVPTLSAGLWARAGRRRWSPRGRSC